MSETYILRDCPNRWRVITDDKTNEFYSIQEAADQIGRLQREIIELRGLTERP